MTLLGEGPRGNRYKLQNKRGQIKLNDIRKGRRVTRDR